MRQFSLARFLSLLAAMGILAYGIFTVYARMNADRDYGPPPDLEGNWAPANTENQSYYQIATIRGDVIECFWYTPSDGSRNLYWSGTFVPPLDGKEPYTWESQNNPRRTRTTRFALRDDTKDFTYKKGQIQYSINDGHLKIGVALVKQEEPES